MNPDDTSNCVLGARCEVCGSAGPRTVRAAQIAEGPICLTVCARCGVAKGIPAFSGMSAKRFVLDHQEHLGVDNNRGGRA